MESRSKFAPPSAYVGNVRTGSDGVEMGLEEAIDLSMYLVAELLRMKREIRERQKKV